MTTRQAQIKAEMSRQWSAGALNEGLMENLRSEMDALPHRHLYGIGYTDTHNRIINSQCAYCHATTHKYDAPKPRWSTVTLTVKVSIDRTLWNRTYGTRDSAASIADDLAETTQWVVAQNLSGRGLDAKVEVKAR